VLKTESDWEATGVNVGEGASIGAGSVCIAPVKIGRWAFIGAGSVVTKDVRDFALVAGNPAKELGWVGEAGLKLELQNEVWVCPKTQQEYEVKGKQLVKVVRN
jgi:acetyltransferase-like isoleucine patch superfamily enzyme